MAVQIGTYSTASYGTAGSMFGSVLNLNVTASLNKTINADNYPVLAGVLPTPAWISLPTGNALEFTNDGGTTWTQAISGTGSGVFVFDGFTTRIAGGGGGNVTFVPLRSLQG